MPFYRFRTLSQLIASLAFFILPCFYSVGEEGMWPPSLLNAALVEQMKAKGFLLSPESIYSTSGPSLKDAVVLFGRGCTAEIISNQGLLLTNHHCGHGQIQSHSTLQNNYLQNGFWAKTKADELSNPGLTISILVRMEDVTKEAEEGILASMSEAEKNAAMDANLRKIATRYTQGTHYKAQIKPFFGGIQQWIVVYETFTDIRLVGAPPTSIGKFGGDTDNWVWPRHTGDFCLFRIYAGKDNKPAEYSPDNVPYTPKKFLPVSTSGIKEGDFTMILGYPGRTSEYLPSYALDVVTNLSNPKKIVLRTSRLNIINEAMKASEINFIRYASTQADIANAWKKWKGELLGMKKADAIGAKQKIENQYRQFHGARSYEGKPFLEALDNLKEGYEQQKKWIIPVQYQSEAIACHPMYGLVNLTQNLLVRKPMVLERAVLDKKRNDFKEMVRQIWKDVDPAVERALFSVTMEAYFKDIPSELHSREVLDLLKDNRPGSGKFLEIFFDKGKWFDSAYVWKLADKMLVSDSSDFVRNPTRKLFTAVNNQFNMVYLPAFKKISNGLDMNQQIFFTGLMEMDKQKQFYPDANQTFRIAFGNVASYTPLDGVKYEWQTTTAGIMEKADTEPDFILDKALKEKYSLQNKSTQGPVPVAFIASNHSTGGNSGSPVLNARGELLGVNFDRVWEGTMSDYYFDSRICRNITCDIRYILWVIENVGDSGHLVKEMELR